MVEIDMAIVIPSSKTYERQNPKVRDNVIERIEVGAVEVVPDNEYETPVYNEKQFSKGLNSPSSSYDPISVRKMNDGENLAVWGCTSFIVYTYTTIGTIRINKIQKNKQIAKLYGESGIKFSLAGIKQKTKTALVKRGFVTMSSLNEYGNFAYSLLENNNYLSEIKESEETIYQFGYNADLTFKLQTRGYKETPIFQNISAQTQPISDVGEETVEFNLKPKLYNNAFVTDTTHIGYYVETELSKSNKGLGEIKITETENSFSIEGLKILTGVAIYALAGGGTTKSGEQLLAKNQQGEDIYNAQLFKISQQAEYVETTIYGDKIGIDLIDKTVYINGTSQKKVHSIERNELMQTSNYYQTSASTVTGAIQNAFTKTRDIYEKGKETATIRCSISDYYDYDRKEKVISIDNSTRKMSFKMYDQVIPMVYGADGQDRPMSTYQDGSPKVFQVLGSNIFYDGAVWQELSLQELDKSEIV